MVGAVAAVPDCDRGVAGMLAGGKNVTGFPVDNCIATGCAGFVVKYNIVVIISSSFSGFSGL
jgi:hypothetical protein